MKSLRIGFLVRSSFVVWSGLWLDRPAATGRQAGLALLAALACAGVMLAWQMPVIKEEWRSEQDKLQQLRTQLDAAQGRLALLQQQAAQESGSAAMAVLPVSALTRGPWHWHRLALAAGLEVDLLKPLEAAASGAAPLKLLLRVRGHYYQHGAFVAALSEPAQAARLLRYQLDSGAAGVHPAELVLELPVSPSSGNVLESPSPRSYRPQAQADPLGEPGPADRWAGLPAHLRTEIERVKEVLETSALSAYFLAGTLQRGGEWLALLQGERMLHTLRVGDHVGLDSGRVMRIAEQGLWLREIERDGQGRWFERERLWRVGEPP